MVDSAVRETILDNGLKVLTVEHRVAPLTSVWVWYRVGSRNERPGITGISHWTEHMCFKGGKEFGKGDIFSEVSRVGGINNGMTGNDYTVYFETVPSAHADLGLRIEADRMANARFDPEEVQSERSVIISEREGAENFPNFLLFEEMSLAAYRTHPYRWSVVGWKSDLQSITHDDLWSYYKDHYAPNNAVLIAVGDFETEAMLADIRRHYEGIEGHAHVPEVRSQEPPQEGERRFALRRPGTASYLDIAFHIPQARHEDEPALRVLTSILSGTGPIAWLSPGAGGWKTSRIYRALVETQLASSASCSVTPRSIDPGLGHFHATVQVGVEPERVEEAMLRLIDEAVSAPPTEDEMEKAKTQLRAAMAYAGESAAGIASMLGQAEMTGSYRDLSRILPDAEAVTPEDVLRVAQTYLTTNNRTTGWFLPTDGGGGCASNGAEAVETAQACSPHPTFFYTGLQAFQKARRETLANGLRIVACRSEVTPSVSVSGFVRGGSVLDDDSQAGRARFAACALERGAEGRSYQEMAETLDAVGATFNVSATTEYLRFGGNALNQHLELLFDIGGGMLMSPDYPDNEIEKVRNELLTSLREAEDNTGEVALKTARQLLYPAGHPFHVWERGEIDTMQRLTREDLVQYHQKAIRPDQMVLVVVGDVEPDRVVELARQRFGPWTVAGEALLPDLSAVAPADIVAQNVIMPNKSQCDIVLGTTGVPRLHEDYLPLSFAISILGQLAFMGRFGKTVRDELGLAYYCYSAAYESRGDAMWFAQAGVNPRNVELAMRTTLEQMRLMQAELVSEEEYDDLIANKLGALARLLETKSSMAQALQNIELWDLGPDYYERYPEIVKSVTREQILEAARKYFRPDAHVQVVAGPEVG